MNLLLHAIYKYVWCSDELNAGARGVLDTLRAQNASRISFTFSFPHHTISDTKQTIKCRKKKNSHLFSAMPFPSLRGDGALERVGGPKHLIHAIFKFCTTKRLSRYICLKRIFGAGASWSTWTIWGPCNVTCGTGIQRRFRTCQGGSQCLGLATETKQCSLPPCHNGEESCDAIG